MELGDDTARNSLSRSIQEVQLDIENKLSDIAHRRLGRHDPEHPRFSDLLRRWQHIEANIMYALESLGQRLEKSGTRPAPKSALRPMQPQTSAQRTEEVVIALKEWQKLVDHRKNSWVETLVSGKILYVNVFDDRQSQWERPDGYIRELPRTRKPSRTSMWDKEARKSLREDLFSTPYGW